MRCVSRSVFRVQRLHGIQGKLRGLSLLVPALLLALSAGAAAADVESVKAQWEMLQKQDAEVMAPKRYREAAKAMQNLDKALASDDFDKQQEKLTKAEEKLEVLNEAVLAVETTWPDLLQLRAWAQDANAVESAPGSWAKAEDQLISATEKMESGRREAAIRQAEPLPDLYREVHKEAVHYNLVGESWKLLREAEKLKVSEYAPRSYVRALDATELVDKLLEELPYDAPEVENAAHEAARKTRHMRWMLDHLISVTKPETRPRLESEIVAWEDALSMTMRTLGLLPEFEGGMKVPLQQVQVEADRLLRERDRLRQQLQLTLANLDSLHGVIQGLKGNVAEYAGVVALLRPFEEDAKVIDMIQGRFTQGEGRVLVENRDLILRLHGMYFESSASEIAPESDHLLDKVVQTIEELPGSYLIIEGHTDNSGRDETNMRLSEERAESIRAYLIRQGIDGGRITTVGYGAAKPVSSNKTEEGRRLNRRIEITISRM